ncbi:serine/threonine-protein kinase Nek7 [Poecilia formosa]|uniref:Serine/threonine-protein kinase Nek7-like n=1 Tax=Poecilia formosa TaxID=48698 RepID=A0A087X8E8_POEFO|nr:PREDICTED: serine/threonine-protein kinase Nek7-like [Poecilia formosa]XP_007572954.1 PREDICTED: serine/threonine-protein kinase Nek7-like [Poecilia formosa]
MAWSTATLAKGCFGKVYRQQYKGTWAAVKKVPQHLIDRKDLERECEVYNKAEHPNIVKLLGNITLTDGKWIIPLEFIFGEDLETTIFQSAKSKIQLTPSTKVTIISGMCEGLMHLHLNDIVHQDLKPENIMVEHTTNRAVIIDLGLAKFFRHGLNSAIDMGNEAYSAPEVLRWRSQRNQRSDVWAMGKIIAELYARVRLHTPSVCPAKVKEVMQGQPYCDIVCKMVEPDPGKRAAMVSIIDEIRVTGRTVIESSTPPKNVQNLLKPPSREHAARPRPRSASPMKPRGNLINRNQLPEKRDNKGPDLLKWERTPRPEIKPLRGHMGLPKHPVTKPAENRNRQEAAGGTDITAQLMKLKLNHEAAKDLPSSLPQTGKVKVQRVERKNGKLETWEQTVVTQDGKIIKYDDVMISST